MCYLLVSEIKTNGTQTRAAINNSVVEEYAAVLEEGGELPPVVVFQDESGDHWLSDGFHRLAAYSAKKKQKIPASVQPGTKDDAILFGASANAEHGLRRTNADKRHAVEMLLSNPLWSGRSDRWIADAARVSRTLISSIKEELAGQVAEKPPQNFDESEEDVLVEYQNKEEFEEAMEELANQEPIAEVEIDKPHVVVGQDGKQYPKAHKEHASTDDDKNPLPEELFPVWTARGVVKSAIKKINDLAKEIKELKKSKAITSAKYIESALIHLNNCKADIHANLATHVCMGCNGTANKKCGWCEGKGWMTKTFYSQWKKQNENA